MAQVSNLDTDNRVQGLRVEIDGITVFHVKPQLKTWSNVTLFEFNSALQKPNSTIDVLKPLPHIYLNATNFTQLSWQSKFDDFLYFNESLDLLCQSND